MCVRLVLLAHDTVLNVLAHKLHKAWPPELRDNELVSFKITGVPGSFMVMAAGKDGATEGVLQEYIDMTLVGQNVVIILLVRETRSEGGGDVLQG